MRRPRTAVIGATVLALTSMAIVGGQLGAAAAAPATTAATTTATTAAVTTALAAARPFQPQPVEWHGCATGGDDQAGVELEKLGGECAEVAVPIDYAAPDGPTLPLAISRLKASDPAQRHGVLFVNPGGPGGPALTMPAFVSKTAPSVQARFDIVGMDPRFVGRSAPIDCHWNVSAVQRGAGPNKRTFAKGAAFAKKLATGCADAKQVLPYVSTRNTARDMDVVRLALGEEKISYLGYSYGTYLGSVYLQMYPQRVDRIVLDSSVEPAAYGPGLFTVSEAAGKAALAHWADWTAKHNSTYKLGKTRKQVLANVDFIRKKVDARPLELGPYSVDSSILPLLFWTSDDSVDASEEQAAITKELLAAAKGVTVVPSDTLAQTLEFVDSAEAAPLLTAQHAVLCGDRAANRNPASYLKAIEKRRKADPLYAPFLYNIGPCAYWPVTPRESLPAIGNSHPVLMVNATGDTQTPYAGAVKLHRALRGSRLVTLKNAYRHGIYLNGASNCVDRTVSKYLTEGVLPRGDLSCITDRTTAMPTGAGFMPRLPLPDGGPAAVPNPLPRVGRYTL